MKELFKTQALEHHAKMLERFQDDIDNCINTVYVREDIPELDSNDIALLYDTNPKIIVTTNDTVSEIIKQKSNSIISNKCVTALNFASFINPGGGFMSGAMAQEESLCHHSDLYERLQKAHDFYDYNMLHRNDGAYLDRLLYSRNVNFIDDSDHVISVDIITCAAPNLQALKAKNLQMSNSVFLKKRISFMLEAAEFEGVDVLILGAWGCGIFGQDPKEVARIFKKELSSYKYGFEKVIFAIPVGYNYTCFKEIFS